MLNPAVLEKGGEVEGEDDTLGLESVAEEEREITGAPENAGGTDPPTVMVPREVEDKVEEDVGEFV